MPDTVCLRCGKVPCVCRARERALAVKAISMLVGGDEAERIVSNLCVPEIIRSGLVGPGKGFDFPEPDEVREKQP